MERLLIDAAYARPYAVGTLMLWGRVVVPIVTNGAGGRKEYGRLHGRLAQWRRRRGHWLGLRWHKFPVDLANNADVYARRAAGIYASRCDGNRFDDAGCGDNFTVDVVGPPLHPMDVVDDTTVEHDRRAHRGGASNTAQSHPWLGSHYDLTCFLSSAAESLPIRDRDPNSPWIPRKEGRN